MPHCTSEASAAFLKATVDVPTFRSIFFSKSVSLSCCSSSTLLLEYRSFFSRAAEILTRARRKHQSPPVLENGTPPFDLDLIDHALLSRNEATQSIADCPNEKLVYFCYRVTLLFRLVKNSAQWTSSVSLSSTFALVTTAMWNSAAVRYPPLHRGGCMDLHDYWELQQRQTMQRELPLVANLDSKRLNSVTISPSRWSVCPQYSVDCFCPKLDCTTIRSSHFHYLPSSRFKNSKYIDRRSRPYS